MKAAVLLINHNWNLSDKKIDITNDITFCNIENTDIGKLYIKLCKDLNYHEGEPITQVAIVLNEDIIDHSFFDYHSSDSIISELCNFISICMSRPLPRYDLLCSADNFNTVSSNPIEIHYEYDLYENLIGPSLNTILSTIDRTFEYSYSINEDHIRDIKTCFENYRQLKTNETRLGNAFSFYFNAWHSRKVDQMCINLAIVLESLFAPSSNTELIYQISFNACKFLGRTENEREKIFALVKKFYGLRSKIVHGSFPKFEELNVLTASMFVLCSEILKMLFTDLNLAQIFIDENKREKQIKKWMFE